VLAEYESLRKVSYRRRKKPVEPEEADPTVATATVKVVDATNGDPIVGATLALDSQPVNDVTDEYGEIDLYNLTLTQHEFTAAADGYQPATLQGATTQGGEDYVFELGLEPEGAG
ncbi:MAG: carboxypeptidase-like regulatory domain-containing protein, partial [Bacteroidales bacterium]|nr:carboxypeptidase-like regulatory domain-containing protein [Bacteroidales bacterium]